MRLLLADDHDLVRDALAAFLASDGIEVATAASLDEAMAAEGPFDLVLLDYSMPGMNGLEGLSRMREAYPARPVALISGTATRAVAEAALASGAAGFLPKTLPARSLVNAVRFMAAGEIFAPVSFLSGDEAADEGLLSPRERQVLEGICAGKSNKEIARDHDLQEVTVKLHAKAINRKLGARNRTHAAMIARDRKLL